MVSSSAEGPRPRVFISSVIEGFENFREAAAAGVRAGGGTPVMAELFPSQSASPRNACLDGVRSSDAFVILVGQRGGWKTPSGALAVEEELQEARRRTLPILAFLEEGERDAEATRLARTLSDYVAGGFRTTFSSPEELREKVAAAVQKQASQMQMQTADPSRVVELLQARIDNSHEAAVRLVVLPERIDELIPPEKIGEQELQDQIYAIAHDPAVRFFDYAFGKTAEVSRDGVLRIAQASDRGRSRKEAALALSQAGEMTLDADVTGRREEENLGQGMFVLLEEDLSAMLATEFRLAAKVLQLLDPYERLGSVWLGAAVVNPGHRYLVKSTPRGGSVPVRMDDGRLVIAEPSARKLARGQLREPKQEVTRLVALFARHLGPTDR